MHIYYRLLNNLILKGNIMEKLPAYKKCYNKLKSDIDNNVYPIGSYLPTEDELGKMFSVSRTTVRHAIDLLVKDKRIKVKQGAGTQVINPKERELTNFSKFHNVIDIHTLFPDDAALTISGTWIDRIPASNQVARALDLNEGTEVFRLQRVVSSNEQPVIIQTNYIRIDFFPDLDTYREQLVDLYYFIQKHYGIKFETGEEHINISSADFLDAQILNIKPGSPIFFNTRTAHCSLGPMEYLEARIRPDLCHFVVRMKEPPAWYDLPEFQKSLERV